MAGVSVNDAMLAYLRDRYAAASADLTTLLTRYLNTEVTAPTATARYLLLIQDALAANGADMLHQATLLQNNADILALDSTFVTIAAAPGAGKIAYPVFALLRIAGTTVYGDAGGDGAQMRICHPWGTPLMTMIGNSVADGIADLQGFFEAFNGGFPQVATMCAALGPIISAGLLSILGKLMEAPTLMENQPIQLFLVNGQPLTGGADGNELRVGLLYVVYDIATGTFE